MIDPKGKRLITHDGDLLFTHFGLSGPVALRCSQFVIKAQKKFKTKEVLLHLDLYPQKKIGNLEENLLSLLENEPHKMIKNVLPQRLPERLLPILLEYAGLDGQATFYQLPKKAFQKFIELLKAYRFTLMGRYLWKKLLLQVEESVSRRSIRKAWRARKKQDSIFVVKFWISMAIQEAITSPVPYLLGMLRGNMQPSKRVGFSWKGQGRAALKLLPLFFHWLFLNIISLFILLDLLILQLDQFQWKQRLPF